MSTSSTNERNADQIAFWNGPAGQLWTDRQETQDIIFAPVSAVLQRAAQAAPGDHVIDIGCGCGATSIETAQRLDASSSAVLGIDVSEPMLQRARERAARVDASHPRPQFILADATTHAFAPASASLLISRFGVMFFADPTAAFTNLRRALKPGGRLAFVCWREPKLNAYFMTPLQAAYKHVPRLPDMAPDAPGPFSFQSPERVQRILADAGYSAIQMTPQDLTLDIGRGQGLEAAVTTATDVGPAHRAMVDQPPEVRAAAVAEIRKALAAAQVGDTVPLAAALWVVTARV